MVRPTFKWTRSTLCNSYITAGGYRKAGGGGGGRSHRTRGQYCPGHGQQRRRGGGLYSSKNWTTAVAGHQTTVINYSSLKCTPVPWTEEEDDATTTRVASTSVVGFPTQPTTHLFLNRLSITSPPFLSILQHNLKIFPWPTIFYFN